MSPRFPTALVLSIVCLTAPAVVFAEVQTFTASHTYILGDHDSKDDARQRCLLETKRTILEQAGVYIESVSEVKNFDLRKDEITSFAAAFMHVKDIKETFEFENRHRTLTLTTTVQVDLEEVRKLLVAHQIDAGVRDEVAAHKARLQYLEAQLEAMQRQHSEHSSGQAPASPPTNRSAAFLRKQLKMATQGDADAQIRLGIMYGEGKYAPQDYARARYWFEKAAAQGSAREQALLGYRYAKGWGVPQDYARAREWFESAAAQGFAEAEYFLGELYANGNGVPQDYAKARLWFEEAAAQGNAFAQVHLGTFYDFGLGVPVDIATARGWYAKSAAQGNTVAQVRLGALYDFGLGVPQNDLRAYMWYSLAAARSTNASDTYAAGRQENVARRMTPTQIAEAQRLAQQCQASQFKGC